uniref:Polyhomeotic homolog 3 n=1 Tax=Echeneis naucrates TaxID=173247 RepID=A0A665X7R0_ECHNA
MERRSPGEKQANTNRSVAATIPTTSAAVTMATGSSGSTTCTQAPPASLSIIPSDRQAVQVIQHAIHRPQSMAAQYLHRMYAAQQQHLMLQTAALQQQQQAPHLQSLATIQQASVCQRRSPSSSTGSLVQPAGVSQNSITLPASPVTAQLIGRTQPTNSTAAATTISQQAMLLGNRPANCNQAQMYLRTQMLILTPAAPVAAVQSDLPAVTSCSSLPTSSQVKILPGRKEKLFVPCSANLLHLIVLIIVLFFALKVIFLNQEPFWDGDKHTYLQAKSERVFLPHIFLFAILPAAYSPLQAHALVKQQLSCPSGQRVAHHQLILQQATAGALNHRQLQPIALRVAPQEPNSNPLPLSVKKQTTSNTLSQTNGDPQTPSTSSSSQSVTNLFSSSAQTSIPAATVQPQPPPLVAAPQRRTTFPQLQNQPPPPPPPLVLPRLPQKPPASLQRLSVHSVQALAVQSGQMLLTEQELPVAEALVQMPYQNLPPPQTVAVDLKVHPVFFWVPFQSGQTCKVKKDEKEDECSPSRKRDRTPTAVIVHSVIRSPQVEEPPHPSTSTTTTTTTSSTSSSSQGSNPPPPPVSLPPPILPTAVRGPSQPPSAPARLPGSPDRILTTHVLTHLIEGFVIREGLEPFPVRPLEIQQTRRWRTMALRQMVRPVCMWGCKCVCGCVTNSWSREVAEWGESVASVLQCEYCGSRGYAQTFLRSKRFCSMSCVRSVSCTKRITMLRAGRWGHRPMGRRGRPPSRVNGASREHFLRQEDEEEEDEPPVPMKTRLRKQAERAQEREREKEREKRMPETIDVSDEGEDAGCPSQWNVEQVFSYISSLPGGQDVAEEFRSQEIDGQALLLLTEDHLVSTMNVKLGPALKICAHINSLKD